MTAPTVCPGVYDDAPHFFTNHEDDDDGRGIAMPFHEPARIDYDNWLYSGPGGPNDDTPWCEECGVEFGQDGECECSKASLDEDEEQ